MRFFKIFITEKTAFVAGFSEINKRGGSNKAYDVCFIKTDTHLLLYTIANVYPF